MVSTCPLISKSSSPCTYDLVSVPSALIMIGITVTFMFHSFFSSLAKCRNWSLFSLSLSFTFWSAGTAKSTIRQVLFFFLTIPRPGRLAEVRWSVCISKSLRTFCVSFSWSDSGLCIYHLFVWSNFNFLHNSQCTLSGFFMPELAIRLFTGVSRTLLSIMADLNNAVVWMISILSPMSNCFNLLSNSLRSVPSAPTITDSTFHGFFSFQEKSKRTSIIIITIIIVCLVLSSGFSMMFKWLLVFTGFQDFFKDSTLS